MTRLLAPAGARRPGRPRDAGAVTVEAALALLALTVVLAGVVAAFGVLGAQLALGEAARAAARVAARSEPAAAVVAEARRLAPGATVAVSAQGEHVVVEVRRSVRAPGLLSGWGEIELAARAIAAAEPT
jgi:hypothetical protein